MRHRWNKAMSNVKAQILKIEVKAEVGVKVARIRF
jgi:hypothetical protein